MGLVKRLFGDATENRAIQTVPWSSAVVESSSTSGVSVNENSSLSFVAVYACVRLIAESIASLPIDTFRTAKAERQEVTPPRWLRYPNVEMNPFELIERIVGALCLWGNAYLLVVRDDIGNVLELWPLDPSQMSVIRDSKSNNLIYTYIGQTVPARDLVHIKGFASPSGFLGLSPVAVGRAAITAGVATDQFAGAFWGNGAHPSGLLTLDAPPNVDDDYIKRMSAAWNSQHKGSKNAYKTAVLTGNAKYTPLSVPAEDAQFLQTRRFQVEEIARLFRVPPHMIGDLDHATFSNIEHQSIDFVVHTLRPWMVRIENALSALLPNMQYIKFNEAALLRGDAQSQAESLKTAWQNGWMSTNEIRAKLELPQSDHSDADKLWVPVNMKEMAEDQPTLKDRAEAVKALHDAGMPLPDALALCGLEALGQFNDPQGMAA